MRLLIIGEWGSRVVCWCIVQRTQNEKKNLQNKGKHDRQKKLGSQKTKKKTRMVAGGYQHGEKGRKKREIPEV